MSKWIAFDEDATVTAAAMVNSAVSFERGIALDAAITNGYNAVVVLPAANGKLTVLSIKRAMPGAIDEEPEAFEPSGILGLTDRVISPGSSADRRTALAKFLRKFRLG